MILLYSLASSMCKFTKKVLEQAHKKMEDLSQQLELFRESNISLSKALEESENSNDQLRYECSTTIESFSRKLNLYGEELRFLRNLATFSYGVLAIAALINIIRIIKG